MPVPDIANIPGPSRPGYGAKDKRFITSWNIDSDFVNQTFYFRRANTGTNNDNTYFDYEIDWGDNTPKETFTNNTTPSHVYTSEGVYDIKIKGLFPGMQLGYRSGNSYYGYAEAEKLLEIKNWGDVQFSSFYYGFMNCYNVVITAKDEPTFRQAGNSGYMVGMFQACRKIKELDLTPFKPMMENMGSGGMIRLCNGMVKAEKIIIPSMTTNVGSNYSDSPFNSIGTNAGMEIINPGSGLAAGSYQTTTDTGNFQIYIDEVDASGGLLEGRYRLINIDNSWVKDTVFNFAGGLQIKLTTEKPGCNLIMKDITFNNPPRFRSFLYNAVINEADLSNWTFPSIDTMSQWLFLNNAGYDSVVNMDNWSTTGNGITTMNSFMNGNRYDKANLRGPKILKTTNWDSSVTNNLTNFSSLGNTASGRYSRLREWHGLNNIKLGKVTTFERMFEYLQYIILADENGRNFSSACMDNRVTTPTSINCTNFFLQAGWVDLDQYPEAKPPNLSGWNFNASNPVSWSQAFYGAGLPGDDTTTPGGITWDLSNADLSNVNSLSTAFRRINYFPTSGENRPSGRQTIKIDSLSSTCTSMYYMGQQSTITDFDLRGSDISSVTNMERIFGEEVSIATNEFGFKFDNTILLNNVTNMVQFVASSRSLFTEDYNNILRALGQTTEQNRVAYFNNSKFDGGLIFPSGRTPEIMTNTGTANKVIDTNKDFVALGVQVGDIVETGPSSNIYQVAAVTNVAATELTLDANIVSASFNDYNIQTSQTAKDRFHILDNPQNWTLIDSGPVTT